MVRLNYYALAVSILGNCIPETAFEKLQRGRSKVMNQLTDADYDDMVKFREAGLSLMDISKIYNIDPAIVSKKVKERKNRIGVQ